MFDDKTAVDPSGLRKKVAAMLAPEATLAEAIRLEVALAEVQGALGVIPAAAAAEIARAGRAEAPSLERVIETRARVGHPMVAIVDTFGEKIAPDAAEWLHFGTTTADVFRTVRMLQMHRVANDLAAAIRRVEARMAALARTYRTTPMVGRTLGRHALPITFGYKVAIWLCEARRAVERLRSWRERFASGVLSGAVGTHAVMGKLGPEVEAAVMTRLGLGLPEPADTKGSTDVFADLGAAFAIAARGFGRIAQEVFLLQGDDIGELSLASSAVGSSTMPHKSNPTVCIEAMSRSREVAAALPVLLEWIVVIHERDSAQHGAVLEQVCIDMAQVVSCMEGLFDTLKVHPDRMLRNLDQTRGAILAENVTIQLADTIGRRSAHRIVKEATHRISADGTTLADALAADPRTAGVSVPPVTEAYGLAPELVDRTLARLGYGAALSETTSDALSAK